MIEWLVTWTLIQTFMVGCPIPEPLVDEYGRVQQIYTRNLNICYDSTIQKMTKRFTSLEGAEKFTKGCGSDCKDFKIELVEE